MKDSEFDCGYDCDYDLDCNENVRLGDGGFG